MTALLYFITAVASLTLCCPVITQTHDYTAMEIAAAGHYIVYLACTGCGYFLIAMGSDYILSSPWIKSRFAAVFNAGVKKFVHTSESASAEVDDDVQSEKQRILTGDTAVDKDVLVLKVRQGVSMLCRARFILPGCSRRICARCTIQASTPCGA